MIRAERFFDGRGAVIFGIAVQKGFSFEENGGWYDEIGVGWPPGFSLMGMYVFEPIAVDTFDFQQQGVCP